MPQLSSKFSRLPALVMVLLGLCAKAPLAGADPLVLKAGIAEPSNSDLAWWMADVGGFFAEQGLKVEFIPGDGNRGLKDLQAGRIDIMHRGLSNIVNVNRSGGDLRLIGCLGDKVRFVFFSAPGVNSSADLKGGVVAISNFGSEGDSAATLALKQLGLTRDDVTIKEVSPSLRAMAAVRSGEVKAVLLSEPFTSLARAQGIHVLIDLNAQNIPWLFTGIAVQHGAIASRRDDFKKFLRATIEGNYLAFSNPRLAKETLAKELKVRDPRALEIAYNDYKHQTPLNADLSAKAAANTLAAFSGISTRVDDYIDGSLLEEIRQEGFVDELQRKLKLP